MMERLKSYALAAESFNDYGNCRQKVWRPHQDTAGAMLSIYTASSPVRSDGDERSSAHLERSCYTISEASDQNVLDVRIANGADVEGWNTDVQRIQWRRRMRQDGH